MNNVPGFWKSELKDVDEIVSKIKKGSVKTVCKTPGNRNVYLIRYGNENRLNRKANLSSALGAKDISCFADKTSEDYVPVLFLAGAVHGGEMEGMAAVLNLINIIETGFDLAGDAHPELEKIIQKCNLLIVPCANPDGRARVPLKSFVGKSLQSLRYYNQGTWTDGSLCDWPDCKKIHPIKEYVDYLGGYYNDNGINLMHDNFFNPMAAETSALMKIADEYAPDFTVLLHGGAAAKANYIIKTPYAPLAVKEEIQQLEEQIYKRCEKERLKFRVTGIGNEENDEPPVAFNLTSAIYHNCGTPCVTYECNQGIDAENVEETYQEIYRQHLVLFEELFCFITKEISSKKQSH